MSKPTAKVVVKELHKDLTKVPYHELTGTTLMRSLPQRRKLSGGVLVDVFLLSVMDANERLDRFNHALRVAHEVLISVLWV